MMSYTTFEALLYEYSASFFWSLQQTSLHATKIFSLCIVISVLISDRDSTFGVDALCLLQFGQKKKASITHCLIRKYHNLKACVVAILNIQGKLKLICKMSMTLASCQTGCEYEPVQIKRIRFLILKSLILLHTLLSSKNTSPSSKHPPPSLPSMYSVFFCKCPISNILQVCFY